ncbi:hypothetical protein WJX82_003901 [Trebouxia sp. C0006]
MFAGLAESSPHGRVAAHKRPLLRVAQELKDRLRFSQLYGESHQEGGCFKHHQAALERSSPVAQELQDRLVFSKLYSSSRALPGSNGKVSTLQALHQTCEEQEEHSFPFEQGVAEMEALQQQLAQARMVISRLASQLDHHKDVQNQLAGHLDASHTEATDLQCTARLYHQAMDECQRLQSENIALRQMLQNALDTGPTPRARSSSRGRNQAPQGREHASCVVKPGLSFVAEQGRSASCALGRSCSPLSSFIRTGGGYAPLEYDTALMTTSAPEHAADEAGAPQLPAGHRHAAAVKPGSWVPSEVVEVVTRFARRLNKEVGWGDIQQLLVLIHQMYGRQEEEHTQELQQQHAKCAHTLRRQAANAEPYIQVRDRQVIAHLKAQLAQAQANRKQPSRAVGRKAQAHVHMAMEKCLHMDRQLEMLAKPHQAPEANHRPVLDPQSHLQLNGQPMSHVQQALSQVFEACHDQDHMGGSNWEDSRQEEEEGGAGGGSFRGVASPNAARLAFARPVQNGGQRIQEKEP